MSRLKRSRALRRNLRKQARKGTLSAREQKTLLQQEKRFRKARRPFMKGLGFGAGLGAGALLVPGVGGLISGLGGLRPGKDDPNEDPQDYSLPKSMTTTDEIVGPQAPRQPERIEDMELPFDLEEIKEDEEVFEDDLPVQDVVVAGEQEEEEGEEKPATEEAPAAEETDYSDPEGMGATRATSGRDGRGQVDEFEDPEGMGATRATESSQVGKLMSALAEMDVPRVNRLLSDLEKMEGPDAVRGLLSDLSPGRFEELKDALPVAPGRMQARPAQQLPVDRPDPRMGTTLDPRLPGVIDRARRSPLFMKQGGRVDKSNDIVARIKRKYGLR